MKPKHWGRVPAPTADEYDTEVVLSFRDSGRYADYKKPAAGTPIWSDGAAVWVAIGDAGVFAPTAAFTAVPPTHPKVLQGLAYLDLWPEARRQCARVLVAVSPMTLGGEGGHGGSCGQFNDDFGWIYATVDDPWGFAEGIVHEMAHWKLRALGIYFEEWGADLLTNAKTDRYVSPVRKDILRPMGAVLHGQYSYIHVAEMARRIIDTKQQPDRQDVEWLELHITRITEGQGTLRTHATGTENGAAFLEALDRWTTAVMLAGSASAAAARERMR